MTSTSAATIAQPPAQPVFGPNARAAQVNVVPQSGSALFSSLYPIEVRKIGTNAITATIGEPRPDHGHDEPERRRQAVRRGGRGDAHDDGGHQPERPVLRPFSTVSRRSSGAPSAVAMTYLLSTFYGIQRFTKLNVG